MGPVSSVDLLVGTAGCWILQYDSYGIGGWDCIGGIPRRGFPLHNSKKLGSNDLKKQREDVPEGMKKTADLTLTKCAIDTLPKVVLFISHLHSYEWGTRV